MTAFISPLNGTGCILNRCSTRMKPACPPGYSKRGYILENRYQHGVYQTLDGDKADKFYADLLGGTEIPKDRTTIGKYFEHNKSNSLNAQSPMADRQPRR